ncbi:transcriptional regulator [uncultured Brevundimonas sp.]|uniref:transcriptional regulator n=1 Tax=uncultured Brevundimonas sp. TaxID=213418 RepID=UPI00261E5BE2|nr:transcriptional regulator [uncultured Brevundimonas sp.]
MLTAAQIRAARALVDWSGSRLAAETGLSLPTIRRMESALGPGRSAADNVSAVQKALEDAGVIFLAADAAGGPGVRLKA